MDLEKLTKLLGQFQERLVAIGLLATAAVGLWSQLLQLNPLTWSWREYAFLSIAVFLVASLIIRSRRASASCLLDSEALKLDPRSPEQLIGRREDLDKLLNALANPLVFLVSKSGCGKSALLRAGVAQGAAFTERYLPIYIDMSVLDWEDGHFACPSREDFPEPFLAAIPLERDWMRVARRGAIRTHFPTSKNVCSSARCCCLINSTTTRPSQGIANIFCQAARVPGALRRRLPGTTHSGACCVNA